MSAIYIAADELKKTLKGYTPAESEKFHRESARMADKELEAVLKKEGSPEEVLLLCGGAASGKTEFYYEHLANRNCIVFDGTLPTPEGARIKIRNIKKRKKKPIVVAILPNDLRQSFVAFLGRERKFGEEHFYRTHAGARRTLLWVAEECPDVEIEIFNSSYAGGKLSLDELNFENREECVDFLKCAQYNEAEIQSLVQS